MIQETRIKTQEVYELPNGKVAVCVDFEQFEFELRGVKEQWWRCHRVDISRGSLTVEEAYTEVIRERYSQDSIEAMASNYNASVSGIDEDKDKEQEYLDFLKWRTETKATVKKSVKKWLSENPMKTEEPSSEITNS